MGHLNLPAAAPEEESLHGGNCTGNLPPVPVPPADAGREPSSAASVSGHPTTVRTPSG